MNSWIIIPARGGSKTIPRKNMALLAGRPLIDYVLRTAATWGRADRIIVSTDDAEIAEHSRSMGAFIAGRPDHLCGGSVPVAAVIAELLEQDKDWPDIIILLQPTSPFVLPQYLWTAFHAFQSDDALGSDGKDINSFETIAELPPNLAPIHRDLLKLASIYYC